MPRYRHLRTTREVDAVGSTAGRLARSGQWELIDGSTPDEDEGDPVGEVPDGTIAEILAWAGNDEARKEAALYAERQGKGRKTLMDKLA